MLNSAPYVNITLAHLLVNESVCISMRVYEFNKFCFRRDW